MQFVRTLALASISGILFCFLQVPLLWILGAIAAVSSASFLLRRRLWVRHYVPRTSHS